MGYLEDFETNNSEGQSDNCIRSCDDFWDPTFNLSQIFVTMVLACAAFTPLDAGFAVIGRPKYCAEHERQVLRAAPQHGARALNGGSGPFVSLDTKGGLQSFAASARNLPSWAKAVIQK